MPPRLTTRIKVLAVLATVALGLSLWVFLYLRAPQPPMTGGGPSDSRSPGSGRPELPPAVQKLLATETKAAARPITPPTLRRAHSQGTGTAWGRDPFDLEAAHPKSQSEVRAGFAAGLRVLGIVWDTTRRHAIINGSVVRVGDEMEGIRIVAIERDRVTVAKGDQQQVLRLGE